MFEKKGIKPSNGSGYIGSYESILKDRESVDGENEEDNLTENDDEIINNILDVIAPSNTEQASQSFIEALNSDQEVIQYELNTTDTIQIENRSSVSNGGSTIEQILQTSTTDKKSKTESSMKVTAISYIHLLLAMAFEGS